MIVAFSWQFYFKSPDLLTITNSWSLTKRQSCPFPVPRQVFSHVFKLPTNPLLFTLRLFSWALFISLCQAFPESGFIPPFPAVRENPLSHKFGLLAGCLPFFPEDCHSSISGKASFPRSMPSTWHIPSTQEIAVTELNTWINEWINKWVKE